MHTFMRHFGKIGVLAGLVALSTLGCAPLTGNLQNDIVAQQTKVQTDVTNALQALSKFTTADLQAAAADATKHNDPEAAMCWNGLIPIVQAIGTGGAQPSVPKIVGGASLFQAIRDVLQGGIGANAGTPVIIKQINMACGPLYVSAKADILKVLAMVGIAAAGGPGVAGAVGSVPTALVPVINSILAIPVKP